MCTISAQKNDFISYRRAGNLLEGGGEGGGSGARVYGGLAYDVGHQRHTHHYHQQQLALRQSHSLSTTIDGVPNEETKKSINNFPCFIFLLSEHTGQQGAPYARACASANV